MILPNLCPILLIVECDSVKKKLLQEMVYHDSNRPLTMFKNQITSLHPSS